MEDNDQFAAFLKAGISGEVRFDAVSRLLYRTDASAYEIEPTGVVLPRSRADVVHLVKTAGEFGVPILPRGGGTSLAGQAVGQAVHVDFSKYMNHILELNAEQRWVRVEPGVVLDELNAFLRPYGLLFAPDVATGNRANIGGMIGNNSCGVHSLLWGKTIDHVCELTVVLADGSVVACGPVSDHLRRQRAEQTDLEGAVYRGVRQVAADEEEEIRRALFRKSCAAFPDTIWTSSIDFELPFDLTKIVTGSEGTLCSVVEARLNLVELPTHKALVACHFETLGEALQANVETAETDPAAVELGRQDPAGSDEGLDRTRETARSFCAVIRERSCSWSITRTALMN